MLLKYKDIHMSLLHENYSAEMLVPLSEHNRETQNKNNGSA